MRAPDLDALIIEYLSQFELQAGAGLIVVEHEEDLVSVSEALSHNEILESRSWWSALERMSSRETTYLILDTHLTAEVFDIIRQVTVNAERVTVRDSKTCEIQSAVVPSSSALLLVASEACVQKVSEEFPLREKVPFVRVIQNN